jgi:hypothetical protein
MASLELDEYIVCVKKVEITCNGCEMSSNRGGIYRWMAAQFKFLGFFWDFFSLNGQKQLLLNSND